MAVQPKRNQPWRACRNPPPIYFDQLDVEEVPEHVEAGLKMALVKKKRKRNQYRLRSNSPEPPSSPPEPVVRRPPRMQKNLWRRLNEDLVESILGHLPVWNLYHTVMAINPIRWTQILAGNDNNINIVLGHGNHVDSSIGYIKTFITPRRFSAYIPREEDLRPPPPRALDHTSQTWQTLPRFPDSSIRLPCSVQSVSEGLILLVIPGDGLHFEHTTRCHRYRHQMVTWNPLLKSRRWLPKSPFTYDDPDYFLNLEVLVVDHEKRGYKVIEFVASVTVLAVRRPGHFRREQIALSGYSVYDSTAATWSAIQPPPENLSPVKLNYNKTSVSCEGCVCFITVESQRLTLWEMPRGIVCYDPSTDLWSEVLFPRKFFDRLPGHHRGCHVKELLYASGRVYLIFTRTLKTLLHAYYIVSIALADIQAGVAAFQHVCRVREAARSSAGLESPDPVKLHPAPKCWPSKPRELILRCPCARACMHRWYMLPVGRTVYLCVVLCGMWHKRFDLDAMVWTDLLIEVPCEMQHDRMATTTVLPSGSECHWERHYFPYIPGWVKV